MKKHAAATLAGACLAVLAEAGSASAEPGWDRVVHAVARHDADEAARCARVIGTSTVAHELASRDLASRAAAVAVAPFVDAPWTLLGALAAIAGQHDPGAATAARHIATAMQLRLGISLDAPATAASHHIGREVGGTDGPGRDDGFDDGFDDDAIADRADAIDAAATVWAALALDDHQLAAVRVDAMTIVAELDEWAARHGLSSRAHLQLQRLLVEPSDDIRRAAIDVVAALPTDSMLHARMKPALSTLIAHDESTEIVLAAAAALCGDGNEPAKLDGDPLLHLRDAVRSKPRELTPTRRAALDAALRCVPAAAPSVASKKSQHGR